MSGLHARLLKRLRGSLNPIPEIGKKNFSGNIFDRLIGLDFILKECSGCSVLDIGSNDGLVSYEFARKRARLVHGFERDGDRVNFSTRLFRDVPVENLFVEANLAISGDEFVNTHQSTLLPEYDIVLFLGVYHHLRKQAEAKHVLSLVEVLLGRAGEWFVDRGRLIHEYESVIRAKGFERVHSLPPIKGKVGPLNIFRRSL